MKSKQPPPLKNHDRDQLSKGLWISLGFHGVFLAALVLRAVFYPTEPIQIQHAIRVDMVALPDKTATLPAAPAAEPSTQAKNEPPAPEIKPELPKPLPKPVVKIPPKPDAKTELKKTREAQTSALQRLEAMKRLETAEREQERRQKQAAATSALANAAARAALIKGNEVSPGTSLTGLAKVEHDDYISSLDDRIKEHWNLPAWLANANLKARVTVYLDSRGLVTKKVLSQSSTNAVFNDKCMEAIDKASPFPPPPARLANIFAVDGFEVGFPE